MASHLTELGATTILDEFHLFDAVREVYAAPVAHWHDGNAMSALTFRREFCEHLASSERQGIHRGHLATATGPVVGAWIVDDALSPDRVADWAQAGAVGVLVPRGTDEEGWMPKMIAGPAPVALPVLAIRSDVTRW